MEPELTSSRVEQGYRAAVSDPVGRRASAALRVFAVAAIGLVMTACGGGGGSSGGGGGGGGGATTGSIAATVTDQFAAPIQNATITATVGSQSFTRNTAADGKVALTGIPAGSVAVSVVASGFKNPAARNVTVTANQTTDFLSQLERSTQAAGGFVTSRVVSLPTNNGQTIEFKVQLLVVNENSEAVENLTPADFTLKDCVVDASNTAPECIRAASVNDDVGYVVSVLPSAPATFAPIPGKPAQPYAAAMVLDQSDSIKDSDPTDARIFASKLFLDKMGVDDRVVLSAFAVDSGTFNLAKIPVQPLTIYGSFTADGASYFNDLDQLAKQEGGETPLYDSLYSMVDYTKTNAPPGIPGQLKAAVLFSDGEDTVCADKKVCRDKVINYATASPRVDLFTIGLSDKVDFEAMAELADRGNGMFLFAESAEQLIPIYGALGNLLSRSLATYEVTWTIQAAAPGAFKPGRTILGSVQVRTASNAVNLPVIVRIPTVP